MQSGFLVYTRAVMLNLFQHHKAATVNLSEVY